MAARRPGHPAVPPGPLGAVRRAQIAQDGQDPRRQLDLSAIGRTGLKAFAGRIYEEWLPELQGERWWRVVREMSDQDPIIASTLFAIEMLLRGADMRVDPANDTNQAHAIADVYQGALTDMSHTWQDTMTNILTMLPWGYSYLECIWKIRGGDVVDPTCRSKFNDGLIGIRKLSVRSQDSFLRWEIDAEGGIQGFWQMAPPTYIPTLIPIEKALLFRTRPKKNNPEGTSLLRGCYQPWYFKKHVQQLAGIGIERDLAGLPVIYAPAEVIDTNGSPQQQRTRTALQEIVTNIRNDEQAGVLMPGDRDEKGNRMYELALLTTGGTRQFDIKAYLNYFDQRIAMTMMADFILLGHEQVGSFALASSKTGLFTAALGAYLDAICATINEHLFTRMQRLNGWPMELLPTLTHGDVESVDLTELSGFVKNLAQSGFDLTQNEAVLNYLLRQAHIPVPEDSANAERTGVQMAPAWGPSTAVSTNGHTGSVAFDPSGPNTPSIVPKDAVPGGEGGATPPSSGLGNSSPAIPTGNASTLSQAAHPAVAPNPPAFPSRGP